MRVRRVVIGLILGLIVGSAIGASQNPVALHVVGILAPVGQLWVNAIRMTVVPLVMSLLFVSIASRDANEPLGRIGAVTIATFVGLLLLAALLAFLLGPPLIADMRLSPEMAAALRASAQSSGKETVTAATQLPGFGAWVASLVPVNVVKTAADGAMLPLIVFTLVFALAARRIESSLRQSLVELFDAIARATTKIVDWIILAAPIGVFALVLVAASKAGLALAGATAYYVVAISAALTLLALLLYPVASMVGGIPLGPFTRVVAPSQAVALSSSSSLASLPALIEGSRAMRLPPAVTGFVLPLSVSTFKVATPVTWMIGTLFLAKLYGIAVPPVSVVTIALTAVALSLTIPGVPQGAQLLLAPVLASYGIPVEGIALLIAADTIPDLVGTMANVTGDLVVATVVARHGVPETEENFEVEIAEPVDDTTFSPNA